MCRNWSRWFSFPQVCFCLCVGGNLKCIFCVHPRKWNIIWKQECGEICSYSCVEHLIFPYLPLHTPLPDIPIPTIAHTFTAYHCTHIYPYSHCSWATVTAFPFPPSNYKKSKTLSVISACTHSIGTWVGAVIWTMHMSDSRGLCFWEC